MAGKLRLVINQESIVDTIALLDTGADMNCVREGLIPTQYYEKTIELYMSKSFKITYQLQNLKCSHLRISKYNE